MRFRYVAIYLFRYFMELIKKGHTMDGNFAKLVTRYAANINDRVYRVRFIFSSEGRWLTTSRWDVCFAQGLFRISFCVAQRVYQDFTSEDYEDRVNNEGYVLNEFTNYRFSIDFLVYATGGGQTYNYGSQQDLLFFFFLLFLCFQANVQDSRNCDCVRGCVVNGICHFSAPFYRSTSWLDLYFVGYMFINGPFFHFMLFYVAMYRASFFRFRRAITKFTNGNSLMIS